MPGLAKEREMRSARTWGMLLILLFLAGCQGQDGGLQEEKIELRLQTPAGETIVHAEVADEPSELQEGLMFREVLEENEGMLFVFKEEARHRFWMKNTLIPLDMVFIAANGTIVDILQADPCPQEPCETYGPKEEARYVLEVNQGFSEEHRVGEGDSVSGMP